MKALSGGERNRLLLARLFTRPANVLVLDEPTNDLDIETLELLEAFLTDWPGTLLLVSHDRAFIDDVVTSTLVFEGDGRVREFVGGYEVEACPLSLWEIAILRGYEVFREVKRNLGGTVVCDRAARTVEYRALEENKL